VNVLVNGAGVAQITDFGHSRLLDDETYATQTRHRGAVVYIAPETLIKMAASEKIDVSTLATKEADIYAFSVTASEVGFVTTSIATHKFMECISRRY